MMCFWTTSETPIVMAFLLVNGQVGPPLFLVEDEELRDQVSSIRRNYFEDDWAIRLGNWEPILVVT